MLEIIVHVTVNKITPNGNLMHIFMLGALSDMQLMSLYWQGVIMEVRFDRTLLLWWESLEILKNSFFFLFLKF